MKRLLVALLGACNSSPADTCDASSSCTDANDTAPPVSGGGCDSSKPQSQGGCAVDDTDGFFVSPMGSDTANGSKATPFKTVQMGATTAAANPLKPNVYICVGTYPENLTLTNATAGVALHGGFDCTSWAQVNGTTNVAPLYATGASQFVVHVAGAAALLESLTVTAPDVSDLDVSSVGVLIDNSVGMTFRRATILAGKAGDGSTATTPSMSSANMSGASAGATTGGAATDCKCAPTDSVGGQGGGTDAGASTGQPSITGQDGGAAGGNTFANCPGGNGANGVDGPPGTSTGTYGGITTHGWVPSNGNAGTSGGTGQGGGGGGSPGNGTGGGGGGCGGCGGVGGVGGGGGGGSIAVAVIASIVRLQVTTLRAGNAGNGGDGAIGQPGQPGGSGGMGWDIDPCTGGTGGMGGAGGASGGGAGGISVALATTDGAMPNIDTQSTLLAGQAGAGGHDGTTMAGKAIDGIAAAQHAF